MAKMITIRQIAVGTHRWNPRDEARIERNLFSFNGETEEMLRFCKNRDGRHNRVHLVIAEGDFVKLFRDAAQKGVFGEETLIELRSILDAWYKDRIGPDTAGEGDPLLPVVGIGDDGSLTKAIDAELYGED